MSPPMEPRLRAVLAEIAARRPRLQLPFLVTLKPGMAVADLTPPLPFEPTLEVALTRLVAGLMTARQAIDLAAHPAVERVEHDGKASALQRLVDEG